MYLSGKQQVHHFANKDLYSQSYDFSSSHIRMWELDHQEGWVPKNWCLWTVVLEKTLESPLGHKEIKPVHPKGNQPWVFIGRTDAEAESPLATWCVEPTHWKRPRCWERVKAGREGATEGEMVGWHHWLNGHEFEQALGVGDGQGSLACCSLWGGQESGITKWLNNSRMDQLGCVPCLFCLGYQRPPLGACLSPSFPPEDRLPLLYVLVPPGPFLHHMGFVVHTHLLHKVRLEPHCQCPQMVIVAALSFHHCYPLLHLMT